MADNVDEEILDKADEWKREEEATKRRTAELRHKRWTAVGRFVKRSVITLAAVSILGGAVGGAYWGITSCNAASDREAAEKKTKEQALDLFYEEEWIKCLDALGREQCEIIQETGLHKCEQRDGVSHTPGYVVCREERFNARYEKIQPPAAD